MNEPSRYQLKVVDSIQWKTSHEEQVWEILLPLGIFRVEQQVTGEENQLSLEKNWS